MKYLRPATIHPAIAELVDQLIGLGARRVILYGSRARGDNLNDRADVDLAVDARRLARDSWRKMREAVDQARILLKIDLVHLQEIPETLKVNIMKDGIIMTSDIIQKRIDNAQQKTADFKKALGRLDDILKEPKSSQLIQDASIQRFEFSYELCWKSIRAWLKVMGVDINFPREAFREAYISKWIPDQDVFLQMIEDRNFMSHTYDLDLADQVYARIPGHFQRMKSALMKLESLPTELAVQEK